MLHFALMNLYALLIGIFFATLWRRERKAQMVLFAKIYFGLVLGGLAVAWLMYPFPSGPPTPGS
jgi:hypothetical protein